MEELLKKQTQHLAKIVSLMETSRLMQVAQTYDLHRSVGDEDHMSQRLDEIAHSSSHPARPEFQIHPEQTTQSVTPTAATMSQEHLDALKKIQAILTKNNQYRAIADRAQGQPIFKSFSDNFRDMKDFFGNMKKSISGISLKGVGQGIASAVSPRYKDRLDYMKNERNLGNTKSDEELKRNYNTRSQMLQRNVKNENLLEKSRGSLTEEEFLKGNSKVAKAYKKEQVAIGKGLKATDTRYSMNERLTDAQKAKQGVDNKFKRASESIRNAASDQANAIQPLGRINLDTSISNALRSRTAPEATRTAPEATRTAPEATRTNVENVLESSRSTKDYQSTQLTNAKEQKDILTDQLTTQQEILKAITKTSETSEPTSNGGGIADTLSTAAEAAGAGKGLSKIGKFIKGNKGTLIKGGLGMAVGAAAEYGGEALKENGYVQTGDAVSTLGSTAQGASTGYMVGSMLGPVEAAIGATAGAAIGATQGFSDTFGEGGFDLIQKLRSEDVISYGFGTTPTVDDWGSIEKLPPEQIQTLISTNEFEGKDLEHLQRLLNPEPVTPEAVTPEATKLEAVTPEATKAEATKAEAVTPEATKLEAITTHEESHIHEVDGQIVESTKTINGVDSGYQIKPEATKPEQVKPYSQLTAEEITSARDEKDIADLENKADQLDKAGLTSGRFKAGQLVIPEQVIPSQAESIYKQSGENAGVAVAGSTSSNNIVNAPTINNNSNTVQNSIVRLPVRNQDTSVNRYISSRYSNQ
jgi:hypothetical protein